MVRPAAIADATCTASLGFIPQTSIHEAIERADHCKIADAAGTVSRVPAEPIMRPSETQSTIPPSSARMRRSGNGFVDVILAEHFLANLQTHFKQTAVTYRRSFQCLSSIFSSKPAFTNLTRTWPEACAKDGVTGTENTNSTVTARRIANDNGAVFPTLGLRDIHLLPDLVRIEQVNAFCD